MKHGESNAEKEDMDMSIQHMRHRSKEDMTMNKIDFTKPLQILATGEWQDVNPCTGHPYLRNKPEPRFVWLNVYSQIDPPAIYRSEETAKAARSYIHKYLHTLKVNVDTGKTEKVYL
jgi:hypothetical protein